MATSPSGMSERDFRRFSAFIYDRCGIHLPPAKKTMLTGRLRKRLKALGMDSFGRYFDYVAGGGNDGDELVHMLDAVSTNKTDFFREPKHFQLLSRKLLPALAGAGGWRPERNFRVWSAGCSSGEEPYTIAMVLQDFSERCAPGSFSVLGTDISTQVLRKATRAVYPEAAAEAVPFALKRSYMMRGKGSMKGFCRIVPELRRRTRFMRLNLNAGRSFGLREPVDAIFCRNVIIYFDRDTQRTLFDRFHEQLTPGGYLFIGHSETLHGISERFDPVAVSVYRKPA